ncbi:MAG: PCMD domain-containing protein [Bacteroidales bacterium]|nr:PCMD domain-containing protein [Bacteroidales bacterium]
MKKIVVFLIASLAISQAFAQTAVPNGDFENWTDQYHIPNWDGLNYDGGFLNFHTFMRTTDAHTGNYAAQVETITQSLIGDIPGIAFTGSIDFDPTTFEYNFNVGVPVEGRPTSLKGFYKYAPEGNDSMAIVIGMFHWDEAQNNLDSIGGGFFFTGNAVGNYTEFEVPIMYFDPVEEADTMYVMLFSSLDSYHVGSVLKVDDLSLNYNPVGMIESVDAENISIFPNPVSDELHVIAGENACVSEFIVTDFLGRIVLKQSFENNFSIVVPENIPGGIYFATIRQNGLSIKTEKIFIRR